MLDSDLKIIVEKAANRWNKAEAIIKKAEIIDGRVIAPAINELRYAGRCLVDVIQLIIKSPQDIKAIIANLNEVEKNCEKAHNDCVDAIVLALRKKLELLEEKFSKTSIAKHIPSYTATKHLLDEADEYIVESRKNRHLRTEKYEAIVTKHIDDIIKCLKSIESNQSLLLDDTEKEIREKSTHKYTKWALIVAVIIAIFDKIYPYIPKFW